jgi:ribosomal protein S4E
MDIISVAGASRNFRNVQHAEKHFQIHEIRHWKYWLYEFSVLAVINHTDAQ